MALMKLLVFALSFSFAQPAEQDDTLTLRCSKSCTVYLDGVQTGTSANSPDTPFYVNIPRSARVIAIDLNRDTTYAGFVASSRRGLLSDLTWKCVRTLEFPWVTYQDWQDPNYDDSGWPFANFYQYDHVRDVPWWVSYSDINNVAMWIGLGYNRDYPKNNVFCRKQIDQLINVRCNKSCDVWVDGNYQGSAASPNNWVFKAPAKSQLIAIDIDNTIFTPGGVMVTSNKGLVSDSSWRCSRVYVPGWQKPDFDDSKWPNAALAFSDNNIYPEQSSNAQWIAAECGYTPGHMYCRHGLGYTGDACYNKPCKNGGTCVLSGSTKYQCQCPAGYKGTNCDIVADPCSSSPCKNGAICSATSGTTYTCQCANGFTGTNCDKVADPCSSNPCKNGAICTATSGTTYTCQCASGYAGTNCDKVADPCSSNPCKNGAKCTTTSGTTYTCQCANGYTGTNCDKVADPCSSSPCKNGAKCTAASGTTYTCQCTSGFTGTNCDKAIIPPGPCNPNPCKNNGVCSASGKEYECDCPPDYDDGDDCSTYQNPCDSSPCENGGTCTRLSAQTFSCKCTSNYYGSFCELEKGKEPCTNQPCLNGGTCKNTSPTTYQCTCPKKYEGVICEKVRCLDNFTQADCANLAYGKYAQCGTGNCNYWIVCRAKKWRRKSCLNKSPNVFFNRVYKNCTATTSSCDGLPGY